MIDDDDDDLDGTFPFAAHFCERQGFRHHYVEEGSGPPVVLVHGEPTWSYLWRHLIGPLSRQHRVVAPDHMGFGKSATPADRSYDVTEHVDNLEALLIDELGLDDITLVLHDWGGTIGGRFALRHPDRVRRIAVIDSVLELGLPDELTHLAEGLAASRWFTELGVAHADGRLEEALAHLGDDPLTLMRDLQGIADASTMTATRRRAYAGPLATDGERRGAVAFPRQVLDGSRSVEPPDPSAVKSLRRKPALCIFGADDRALPAEPLTAIFREAYPQAPVILLEDCGHFAPEEQPAAVLAALEVFVTIEAVAAVT